MLGNGDERDKSAKIRSQPKSWSERIFKLSSALFGYFQSVPEAAATEFARAAKGLAGPFSELS